MSWPTLTVLGIIVVNCAITGAHGYVGLHLKRFFEQKGYRVYSLVRDPTPDESDVRFELGQSLEPEEFAKRNIKILIHCAYDFSVRRWPDIYERNVKGSRVLFESARRGGVQELVLVSSLSAFPQCRSLYGQAKWEIEKIVFELGGIVLRCGLVFGENPGGMMGSLKKRVMSSRILPVISHPRKSLRLIHEDDLAELIFRLVTGQISKPTQPVLAAEKTGWTLEDIIHQLAIKYQKSIVALPLPWYFVWGILRLLESFGINTAFRSDSVIVLGHPNPEDDAVYIPPVQFRQFQEVL